MIEQCYKLLKRMGVCRNTNDFKEDRTRPTRKELRELVINLTRHINGREDKAKFNKIWMEQLKGRTKNGGKKVSTAFMNEWNIYKTCSNEDRTTQALEELMQTIANVCLDKW